MISKGKDGVVKKGSGHILGHVVGTVGERGSSSGHDLQERIHVLSPVIVVLGVGVRHLEVSCQDVTLLLQTDNILLDTTEEEATELPEEHDGVVGAFAFGAGTNEAE